MLLRADETAIGACRMCLAYSMFSEVLRSFPLISEAADLDAPQNGQFVDA